MVDVKNNHERVRCPFWNDLGSGGCHSGRGRFDFQMGKSIEKGTVAPGFSAVAVGGEFGDGKRVSLSDFIGRPVVLYFYPKDDTPGCTTQAWSLG